MSPRDQLLLDVAQGVFELSPDLMRIRQRAVRKQPVRVAVLDGRQDERVAAEKRESGRNEDVGHDGI